jgi:uncharacterized membrane protein
MYKRVLIALLSGAFLGLFCILGATLRLGWEGNQLLILSLWYNRLVMGLLIGLAVDLKIIKGELNWLLRGALLGLVVSAAYFLTSGAGDVVSFLAGIVYGMIIEFVLRLQK